MYFNGRKFKQNFIHISFKSLKQKKNIFVAITQTNFCPHVIGILA